MCDTQAEGDIIALGIHPLQRNESIVEHSEPLGDGPGP